MARWWLPSPRKARCASANDAHSRAGVSASLDQLQLRHEPLSVPTNRPRNRNQENAGHHEGKGSPKDLQPAAIESEFAPRTSDVPANPAQPGRNHPSPADDRKYRKYHQQLPTDETPHAAIELQS